MKHFIQKTLEKWKELYFSGLMIALTNHTFRNTYQSIQKPSKEEADKIKKTLQEAHCLNDSYSVEIILYTYNQPF